MKKLYLLLIFSIAMSVIACNSSVKDQNTTEDKENQHLDMELKGKLSLFSALPDTQLYQTDLFSPKVKLGYMLYYDNRLSKDGKNSCNSCHNLATYGVDNLPTSPGDKGIFGDRNSPSTLNAALHASQFWDARAKDVEEQAGMPILNPVEMNIPSEAFLVERLKEIKLYKELFAAAYPNDKAPISYTNLRNALGAFERVLITPSRFDQYLVGKSDALSLQEKRGMLDFANIGCITCHNGALLGGGMVQKAGVHGDYWTFTNSKKHDEGRAGVTKNEIDKFMFKVPSLRNVEKTYPYFHDGSVTDLSQMVKIMGKMQLNNTLSDEQTADIVAFLKTLTGDVPEQFKKAPHELTAN